jgi:hypothetical protein
MITNESQLEATGAEMSEVTRWIVGRDTGTSSKTIWSVMMGAEPDYHGEPSDPDDFGRCYRLLKIAPASWRANLSRVSDKYPVWTALVRQWDELTALYEDELVNGPIDKKYRVRMAPKTYARMKELIDEGRIIAGWTKTGPGSWTGPKRERVVSLGNGVSFSTGK